MRDGRTGATLVELLLTLALLALLFGIALPALTATLDAEGARGAAVEVVAAFATARGRAIVRGAPVAVLLDSARRTVVVRDGGDTVLCRDLGDAHGVSVSASRDSMAFGASGLGYGAANLRVVVRRGAASETVYVSRLGRVRWR
jgi:type IV fimbrial biogenesis protein FimT